MLTNIRTKVWAHGLGLQRPWERHHAVLVRPCQVHQQEEQEESTVKMDTPVGSHLHLHPFLSRLRVALVVPLQAA